MSAAICPTCERELDPTHAPVARVRGTRIVTFCSQACAEGSAAAVPPKAAADAETAPVAAPAKSARPAQTSKPTSTPQPHVAAKPLAKPKAVTAAAKPARAPSIDDGWDAAPPPRIKPKPVRERSEMTEWADQAASAQEAAVASAAADLAVDEPVPDLRQRRTSRKAKVIALCGVIVAGGMTLAIIDGVSPGRSSDVDAARPQAPAAPVADKSVDIPADSAQPETPPTEDRALELASQELTLLMSSESPRVRRLAAVALSRSSDPAAVGALEEMLTTETSELNRVGVAHALARAGKQSGTDALVAALTNKRRDVRTDAAQCLLDLGDERGSDVLRKMLSLRNMQLSAAAALARIGDGRALELLRSTLRKKSTDKESKMRAAVALGRAGDESVSKELHKMLSDGRYSVGAASALAALGDDAAVEPLTAQLSLNSLRVDAAKALRSMGKRLDRKVVSELVAALTRDDEVTKVTAAEAILILALPGDSAGGGK